MNTFPLVPATRGSLAARKPLYGVGVNDAPYMAYIKRNGAALKCPFYVRWASMMKRAYSPMYSRQTPAYKGVTVCAEWHSFMTFRAWMVEQDWEGRELDKDILKSGNKVYGPEFCVFVSQATNAILTNADGAFNGLPVGVQRNKNRFISTCSVSGTPVFTGSFLTAKLAGAAYMQHKAAALTVAADCEADSRVRGALLLRASELAA